MQIRWAVISGVFALALLVCVVVPVEEISLSFGKSGLLPVAQISVPKPIGAETVLLQQKHRVSLKPSDQSESAGLRQAPMGPTGPTGPVGPPGPPWPPGSAEPTWTPVPSPAPSPNSSWSWTSTPAPEDNSSSPEDNSSSTPSLSWTSTPAPEAATPALEDHWTCYDANSTCCGCLSDEYPGDWNNGDCCGHCTVACGPMSSPATPAPPTVAQSPWTLVSGSCMVNEEGCATSPNYPHAYSNDQSCLINVGVNSLPIHVVGSFNIEQGYDFLVVNGLNYPASSWHQSGGSQNPEGIVPTGNIHWSSDYTATRSGWKICASGPSAGWSAGSSAGSSAGPSTGPSAVAGPWAV